MQMLVNPAPAETSSSVFSRILVGVDGSEQALEAARQAAILQQDEGQLTLVTVWNIAPTVVVGSETSADSYFDAELQAEHGERALLAARDYVAPYAGAISKLIRGVPTERLLREVERDQDTLVAVGGSGIGRLRGIAEGSVCTEIVHQAPCSVLIARQAGGGFPRHLVVGVDGSVESAAAYAAARYLRDRFAAELTALVARGRTQVDERMVAAIVGSDHVDSPERPAQALIEVGADADLIVVGSRGLRGVRALGSISERVAHEAPCSVLIVREPLWQRIDEELHR